MAWLPILTWRGRGNCRRVQPRVSNRPRRRAGLPLHPTIVLLPPPVLSTALLLPMTTRIPKILLRPLCLRPSTLANLSLPSRMRSPTTYPARTSNLYKRGNDGLPFTSLATSCARSVLTADILTATVVSLPNPLPARVTNGSVMVFSKGIGQNPSKKRESSRKIRKTHPRTV